MAKKIDVRVKIFVLAGLLSLVLSSGGFLFPGVVFGVCLLMCLFGGIPVKRFVRRFSEPAFVLVVIVFIKSLSGGDELFGFGLFGYKVAVFSDGMFEGFGIALRILAAVSAVSVLSLSTPLPDILSGLLWFRFPRGFVEVTLFAYRYVRVLFEEAQVIYYSQKNRLGYSSLARSLNSFGILAGSLTIKAFDQAQATGTAMLQRGYDGKAVHLISRRKPMGAREIFGAGVFLSLMAAVWINLR